MTKTAKTAETIEFPSFDASKATDQMRAIAEKGVEQSKEAYEKIKTSAETTQKALEQTLEASRANGTELSLKSIAALRAGAEAGFSHLEALMNVRSFSEMIELQTAFVRKSAEMAVENAKEFQALSSKSYEDVSKPVRELMEKSFKELKAA